MKKTGDGVEGLLSVISHSQAVHDGPTWRYRLALAELPPRESIRDVQAAALDAEEDYERRLVLGTSMAGAACRLESRTPTDAETDVLQRLLNLPAPEPDPPPTKESRRHIVINSSPPIVSGRIEAMTEAIGLVGLTHDQAESAVAICGRGSVNDGHTLSTAIRRAGYTDLLNKKGPMAGMAAAMKAFTSAHEDNRQTTYILEQAVSAVTRRAPDPSWRLESAAALLELLDLENQHVGHVGWAVDERPTEVTNLVQLASRSPGLDASQLAADALAAKEVVRQAPLSGWWFLLLPPDPRRAVAPTWVTASLADLPWLSECVRCPSHWLNVFGAYLISGMTDVDGDALLLEEIGEVSADFRHQLATALLDDKATHELHTTWFAHSDPLVKAAAARVLAKRQLEPAVLEAIASDPDLTVRFAALRSSASADGDMFERAAEIAAASEPGFWTCTDCGGAQSPEDRDCAGCTRGTRSDLTEEIKRLREKPENATQA